MNKYQNALDRISSIDLDMALDAVNYDYDDVELVDDEMNINSIDECDIEED